MKYVSYVVLVIGNSVQAIVILLIFSHNVAAVMNLYVVEKTIIVTWFVRAVAKSTCIRISLEVADANLELAKRVPVVAH